MAQVASARRVRAAVPARVPLDQAATAAALERALAHAKAGLADRALALLGKALGDLGANEVAAFTAGFVLLHGGHPRRALAWFDRAVALRPAYSQAHAARLEALRALGRFEDALARATEALSLCPGEPELLVNRAFALHALGRLDEALHAHDEALARRPEHSAALIDRALILERLGKLDTALASLDAALAGDASLAHGWCNRGNVLHALGRWADAAASYGCALAARPAFPEALIGRAAARRALGQTEQALGDIAAALQLDPRLADAWINRAIVLQDLARWGEALASYRRAQELRPLVVVPAIRAPAAFTALFVMAPGAGNTPPDSLVGAAEYESRILMLLPGAAPDEKALAKADVVVNLISDVDRSAEALALAGPLLARLGRPVVNPPARILATGRAAMAAALAGISDCVVPATRRLGRAALREAARGSFPCLVRPAGTHGGEDFEKVEDMASLDGFLAAHGDGEFYLIPYVDYRSPDGFFRKYRMMWVGGAILPYHLAIGSHWKVHHASTDMAAHAWMQVEERRFLERPAEMFGARAGAALAAIGERVGLDYFGIDCGLDRNGQVVVFEVNASMLVHQRNAAFPYKAQAVTRIKHAFDTMLARKTGRPTG